MGFKGNVLFYLNEAKKNKDYEEKRKVCAGDEADGSSVKTHKGAYTGSEPCMASKKTENGCTGSEASDNTENADKLADKEAKKLTYGAVAKRNRMMQDNQDFLDRYVDSISKKNKKLSSDDTEEDKNTVDYVTKKYGDKEIKFSMDKEANRKNKPAKSKKLSDEDMEEFTVDYVEKNHKDEKPTKGKKMQPNTERVKEIVKGAALAGNKSCNTEVCPKCGKEKCKCSCKTEEASTVAAYDQRKFKTQEGTNETKPKGSMLSYQIGKMSGVSMGRKQSMEKYNDYDSSKKEKVPGTNETKTKGKMKGFSLKEEIIHYTKDTSSLLSEEDGRLELITESIKSKSTSKKLMKVAKRLDKEAEKAENAELKRTLLKNSRLFKEAYIKINDVEDRYRIGDKKAKEDFEKLTKKYSEQFKVINRGKTAKMVAAGCGIGAVIILVGGAILVGIQGMFEPGIQVAGIGKSIIENPFNGLKDFFSFGKKIVSNDVDVVKKFMDTKDIESVKEVLKQNGTKNALSDETTKNLFKGVEAKEKINAAGNSVKDFITKMGKKGASDEGDSSFNAVNV